MYDELIKALHDGAEFLESSTPGIKNSFAKMCHNAADAIAEQQVIIRAQKAVLDQAPHWIPSEDCLPVNGEEVITLGPNGGMECGFYRGLCGTKRDKWEWKKHTVRTAKYWMPRKALPEPPKEE